MPTSGRIRLGAAVAIGILLLSGCGHKVARSIDRLGSEKKGERDAALMELMLAKESAIAPLILALADQSRPPRARVNIAEALFRIYVRGNDPRIVPALLAHVADPAAEVRAQIALALSDAGAREATDVLLERLSVESDTHVCGNLLTALKVLGDFRDVGRSILAVKGGEDFTEQQRWRFVERLKQLYGHKDSKVLRDQAEELLETIAQQHIQEADKYVLAADLAGAEAKYLEARSLAPQSLNVTRQLARFYFQNGWRDRGLELLQDKGLMLRARHLEQMPRMDGDPCDEVWDQAAKITRFYQCVPSLRPVAAQARSEAYVGHVDDHLVLAVKAYEESTGDLAAVYKKRDDPAWRDDCAEIYLDTNLDAHTHYQIIVNCIGTIDDYAYADEAVGYRAGHDWDGEYHVATQIQQDFWALEIAIPFSHVTSAEVRKGTIWGFNVGRVRVAHKREHGQWVPTQGVTNRPGLFGFLIFE